MDLSFISAQDQAEAKDAQEKGVAMDHATATAAIAGEVKSHQPRERAFDDREQKIVQGRLWLISFTDLFSIMLCFFVLMYSMKDPDFTKISKLTGKGQSAMFSGAGKGEGAGSFTGPNINRVAYGEALNLDYLQGILKNTLVAVKLENDVRIVSGRDHLKLRVDSEKVFAGNLLTPDGERIAKGLAARLNILSNRITVVAMPDSSGDFTQSLAQASAFGEVMRDNGYRKPFIILGESTNATPGIEIRVEADDGRVQ